MVFGSNKRRWWFNTEVVSKSQYDQALANLNRELKNIQSQIDALKSADPVDPPETETPPTQPEPEAPKECPTQLPEGIRWHQDEVLFHFSPNLKQSDRKWLIEEFVLLKVFVEKSCALKVNMTDDANKAHVKNVVIGEIDGQGGTLGETRYSYRGDQMIECTVVCDEADQGSSKRTTKKHEFIHCFGIPHDEVNSASLMWWASNGTARDYGEYSATELFKRHPINKK